MNHKDNLSLQKISTAKKHANRIKQMQITDNSARVTTVPTALEQAHKKGRYWLRFILLKFNTHGC